MPLRMASVPSLGAGQLASCPGTVSATQEAGPHSRYHASTLVGAVQPADRGTQFLLLVSHCLQRCVVAAVLSQLVRPEELLRQLNCFPCGRCPFRVSWNGRCCHSL